MGTDVDVAPVPDDSIGGLRSFIKLCSIPDFSKFVLFFSCLTIGASCSGTFVFVPLQGKIMGDEAVPFQSTITALNACLAMLAAPYFGRWSDNGHRRLSVVLVLLGTSAPVLAIFFLGETSNAVWTIGVLWVLTGPMMVQASGSPVIWAWIADSMPQHQMELGMSVVFAAGSFASWAVAVCANAASASVTDFVLISVAIMVVGAAIAFASGANQVPEQERLQQSCMASLLSPLQLVSGRRSLGSLCVISALLTLPDVAALYIAPQLAFEMRGLSDEAEEQAFLTYFLSWPGLVTMVLFPVVGFIGQRIGASAALVLLSPLCCAAFASPAFLAIAGGPVVTVLTGTGMFMTLALYPLINAMVVAVTPPHCRGEALGAVAACKNLCTLIAPFISAAVTQTMLKCGRSDLYWTFFPVAALIMLLSWPFSISLWCRLRTESAGGNCSSTCSVLESNTRDLARNPDAA